MTALRAGMKVVCVNDTPQTTSSRSLDGLRKGEVYTIRRVGPDLDIGIVCVWLGEITRRGSSHWIDELGFCPSRFRRVKTTSIECFKALLAPANKKQRERA
jgi:hypothetical protein